MNSAEKTDILNKLANNGIWEQLNQLQEECAEVISAVNRLRRKKPKAYENLCEEVADLKIMLDQMYILLDSAVIEQKTTEKYYRIKQRLSSGQL